MTPFQKLTALLATQKKEIYAIYTFAIVSGIIQLSLPLGVQSIIGFVMGGSFSTSLIVLIGLVLLGVYLSGNLQIQQMKVIEKIQQWLFHRYAFLFKSSLLNTDLKKADDGYFPELMNRFLDISTLQKGLSKILLDIPIASIQIILGLLIVSIYHPLFLVMVIIMIIIIAGLFYLTSKKGLETSIKESSYKYETTNWLEEVARMIDTFKINRAYHLSSKKLDQKAINYLNYRTKHFSILLFQYKNLIFLKMMITATMLIVGAYLLINQQLNIGQFIAAELIILTIISSVEKLIVNLDTYYDVLTAIDKLHYIESKPDEEDGTYPLTLYTQGMHIVCKQLSFAYHDANWVFDNLSFEIQAGEKVAVIGKDGSGKTTLFKILSTLYEINKGSLLFNGTPLHQLQKNEIRSHIGIMLNKLDLFKGTIAENITMGNPQVTLPQIMQIAHKIGLDDFINQTDKAYDSYIETTGKKLPRSIIKKILFIRAVVTNAPLVLLEEPFSEIDDVSIQAMQDYIIHEMPHSTVLVFSNDASFMHLANQCFNLSDIQTLNKK